MKKRTKSKIRKFFRKRVTRGFTLVEVIISTLLLGILVVGVTAFTGPVLNMVQQNKSNGRATMLAETINTYLAGTLRKAQHLVVVENVPDPLKTGVFDDAGTNGMNLIINSSDELKELRNIDAKDLEIRCISIRWFPGILKPVIVNEKVRMKPGKSDYKEGFYLDQGVTATGTLWKEAYDSQMYKDLYPIVKLEPYTPDSTSSALPGVKITTDVYTSPKCYNKLNKNIRDSANPAFTGVSYISCPNMPKTGAINATTQYGGMNTDSAIESYTGGTFVGTQGENQYYYPDTFIFYTVYKANVGA